MFDNITPDKAQELGNFFSNAAVWVLILGGILIAIYIGFTIYRKQKAKKGDNKPRYNRTAFAGGCFGIIYNATEEDPAYVAVFDDSGVEIMRTYQDNEDAFLGLAEENNQLILYTMDTNSVYHKFYFDKEQVSFSEL